MKALETIARVHDKTVHGRRVRVLAAHLAPLFPPGLRVLDVGCGDGRIASLLMELRPDLMIEGVDVLARDNAAIPVRSFDGRTLPYERDAYDAVMLVDVLHHADVPTELLAEANRVARRCLVIKDHRRTGPIAAATLRFMDWVGNRAHGVALPYNYLSPSDWTQAFAAEGLMVREEQIRLGLYPWPATWAFDRDLHFVARIEPNEATRS